MNILITNLMFSSLAGSELYTYELSRTLVELGHRVTVLTASVGGEITDKAREAGVIVTDVPPKNDFDVLHLHHKPLFEKIINQYASVPAIQVCHSEYLDPWEAPSDCPNIKAYVAVRESIVPKFNNCKKVSVIYNPIDQNRFYNTHSKGNGVLFVGTKDYLREKVVADLKKKFEKVVCVGYGWENPPTWNVESYIWKSEATAGILMGRTTLESWCCGKPSYMYDVDSEGNIKSVKLTQPPKDLDPYNRYSVAQQFIKLYREVVCADSQS